MCPNLSVESFLPIISRRASNVLADFDDKTCLQSKQYKFGIIYQKQNQYTEEQIFQNNNLSQEFEKFLGILGDVITLQGHQGFSGGLDTKHNQTGTKTVFTVFNGYEIMFHVGPFLPFRFNFSKYFFLYYHFFSSSPTDQQQLGRKRHIGNDIVSIVDMLGNILR